MIFSEIFISLLKVISYKLILSGPNRVNLESDINSVINFIKDDIRYVTTFIFRPE